MTRHLYMLVNNYSYSLLKTAHIDGKMTPINKNNINCQDQYTYHHLQVQVGVHLSQTFH